MATASFAVHVNGEAQIKVMDVSGGSELGYSSLEPLGVSVDGVKLTFRGNFDDVMTDTFGPNVPQDVQHFLQDAVIQCELVFYDQAVLTAIRKRAGSVAGLEPAAGTLMYGGGGSYAHVYRLLVLSPVDALPWNFPTVYLMDAHEVKVGTKRSIWNCQWRALPLTGWTQGSSAGAVLFNTTTS